MTDITELAQLRAELLNPAVGSKDHLRKLALSLVEALEKAQIAGSINNQWKPDVCPITGRRFFMWIEHPELGYVPTYGGPYDSYTIPTRDSDGEFSCERYDHDVGGWVDGECVGAYLIDDDEQCRVYELEQRIGELESRTVTPVTFSENADADYCRKWAWEQVKGEVSTEDWTTGDSITYFGFFCWGWDMRRQYNEQRAVTVKLPDIMPPEAAPAHYWGSGESMAYAEGYNKSAVDLKTSFTQACSSVGVNVEFE